MSHQAGETRSDDTTPDVEVGMEEPSNDVLEQHRTEIDEDEMDTQGSSDRPLEADAADLEEQRRGVPAEDERRDE